MRTRASARSDGRMKVVSERLNCSASACICAASSAAPSSNTHSGLPERRSPGRANTFRIRYASRMAARTPVGPPSVGPASAGHQHHRTAVRLKPRPQALYARIACCHGFSLVALRNTASEAIAPPRPACALPSGRRHRGPKVGKTAWRPRITPAAICVGAPRLARRWPWRSREPSCPNRRAWEWASEGGWVPHRKSYPHPSQGC